MQARHRPRRTSPVALAGAAAALLLAACGTSTPSPSNPAQSGVAITSSGSLVPSPSASSSSPSQVVESLGPGASGLPGTSAPPPVIESVEPFTPPPVSEPQDDDVCLAFLPRATVESALGSAVGNIMADGTDPNTSLTCTYPLTAGGQLLVTTAAGDPAGAFQTELDTATTYGQDPQALDGVGDQAFYAAASSSAPEQVVFTKGPVLVRLWNQTTVRVGSTKFRTMAAKAADAIRAEIPPAP